MITGIYNLSPRYLITLVFHSYTVKEYGGWVVGIITHHLIEQEKPLKILDELHIVDSMQQRKTMMQKISDMFVVMLGSLGILEEAIETWNAIKIGELIKPIGFLILTHVTHTQF
ncbi:lysine decarboxylase [Legionella santicrucis]|uniref:AMP nucleosidase n=1 Tax=Legionella santicrucis TaxID=45074 RepID=A0A0W0YLS9_9GAMM|nr:LOG family protein [Legionella santicrucis]KTD57837.1 lysine decarboxylase [Legionella santicrucis]